MSFTTRLTDNRPREDIFYFYLCIHVLSGIPDTCMYMYEPSRRDTKPESILPTPVSMILSRIIFRINLRIPLYIFGVYVPSFTITRITEFWPWHRIWHVEARNFVYCWAFSEMLIAILSISRNFENYFAFPAEFRPTPTYKSN